ncbi:MAG TPA: cation:proton antiporter [Bacteroidetes bacterium]|nr:cation:proton antiporter [Bacteroidota bacterium]
MFWELELVLFVFLALAAILAIEAKDLLVSVVLMTAFSFITALLYISMGAVDVGFTEAVVGAGVTGILFVLVLFKTSRETKD